MPHLFLIDVIVVTGDGTNIRVVEFWREQQTKIREEQEQTNAAQKVSLLLYHYDVVPCGGGI